MSNLLCLPLLLALVPGGVRPAEDGASDRAKGLSKNPAVVRGAAAKVVRARGTLQPEEVIDVGADVAGRVAKFGTDPERNGPIDFGSRVKEGTVLVQLDDSLCRARVERAKAHLLVTEATVKVDEAQLSLAERELESARKLLARQAMSREDFDNTVARCGVARARIEVSKAAVLEARAGLKEAEVNLASRTIRSPVAGVVIDRRVNVGQVVAPYPGSPSLFLIARDPKRLQVWALVNEGDIGRVRVGQRATFTVDAYPGKVFQGKVAQVRLNATWMKDVVSYTVVIDADNAGGNLLPYLTADIEIAVGQRKDQPPARRPGRVKNGR
jgi:HlyD family secretion protein